MKTHTTNYQNTFLGVASDTKAVRGIKPPCKAKKTIAEYQYELIAMQPYRYTSDEVLFLVYAERNGLGKEEYPAAREKFFSRGQACLRTSPLTKTYGFGIHFNAEGKIAAYGMETPEYEKYSSDPGLKQVEAVRSSRAGK